jgi:hypothetical protein
VAVFGDTSGFGSVEGGCRLAIGDFRAAQPEKMSVKNIVERMRADGRRQKLRGQVARLQ